YAVNITVGTPPVQLQVELDTGSSDLWVISTKAPVCKRYNCNIYGVFDKDKSSSWKSNGTEFGIRYVDGSGNDGGIYGQDTINFGNGLVLNNATFAVANETVDLVGIMGISFEFREAATQKYPNIPSLMKLQGYTKKTAYSLYVTDEVKQAGSILFGGIDHAKYEGELVSLDMVASNGTYRALQTELTSIKIYENDVAIGIPFTFDSGADITIIREDFLEQIYKVLAPGEDFQVYGTLGTYKVPCYLNDSGNFLSFSFSNKKEIQVPMSEFLLSQETANGIQCGLKISTPSPGLEDHGIFGVNFLRSVYTVFNLDDKTISLAKVKYSEDERITAIE
ncbi:secreted aspartyl proteinase, partial [Scheffersomyces stipitis CBS 6054]